MPNIIELNEQSLPGNCFVFKHSTRCPVSFAAADAVKAIDWQLPLYWINVVEQRALSNWIAENFSVKHESPQLLHLVDGKVAKVLNHGSINLRTISELSPN